MLRYKVFGRHHRKEQSKLAEHNFDYIIVGGGSAGCIVAARLVEESDASVLLVEAGEQAERNPDTLSADGFKYCFANDNVMWDRMSERQANCGNRPMYVGTGTGMGGSGSVNGMVYTPGDKRDFAQWPDNWKWDDIAPTFEKLTQRLDVRHREGTAFTEIALDAAETIGFKRKNDMIDGEIGGFMGYNAMNFRDDERRSSYVSFLKGEVHPKLTIVTQARASRVLFEDKHAVGIEYVLNGKKLIAKAAKEVVLTAGALQTPKLLMLSGVGPKAHLAANGITVVHDAPSIGENLQDHTNVCMFLNGKKPIDFGYPQVYGFERFNPDLDLPDDTQPDTCIAMLSAPITVQQSMYRMVPATLLPPKLFGNKYLRKIIRLLIDGVFAIPKVKKLVANTYGIVVILGKPTSRGRLRLASGHYDDEALIDPNYYANDEDLQTMLNGVIKAKAMAKTDSLKEWGSRLLLPPTKSNNPETLKKWIKTASMTTFHFCGTCSMGEEDQYPVNTDLSLKGMTGLRIADASVIPVIPVSALNAPSMMIAYRAADFILAKQ